MNKKPLLAFGDFSKFSVAYRLPGENEITTVIQEDPAPNFIDNQEMLDKSSGFVFAAFPDKNKLPDFLIRPDVVSKHSRLEKSKFSETGKGLKHSGITDLDQESYMDLIESAISTIQNSALKKVILSRTLTLPVSSEHDWISYFNALSLAYPAAFVYMANLPGYGTWIGATPEVLTDISEGKLTTVSLAGTKSNENVAWTNKEIEEQKMVSDYIENILRNNGIVDFEVSGPADKNTGSVVHLQTVFTANTASLNGKVGHFITDLHPTPAICGIPKQKALDYIHSTEKHQREYYSGFLGPLNLNDETKLFVNLRCMKIYENHFKLFLGGGITASSQAQAEWNETLWKADTLLKVIAQI